MKIGRMENMDEWYFLSGPTKFNPQTKEKRGRRTRRGNTITILPLL
jgi:ribosomal protein S6E (S10)